MELRYPILVIIGLIVVILIFILIKSKKKTYKQGNKIANTHFIKNTTYYQKKIKQYKTLLLLSKLLCLFVIFISFYLLSRPYTTDKIDKKQYSRDIILCMDISSSVDNLNYELVDNLKQTVKSLKGERFGISIFNTTSVTLVPLTDDYEYVISVLDQIKKSIDTRYSYDFMSENYLYNSDYIISGTIEGWEESGSSLIGDGLATCIFNFSKQEEQRTKIIIFSTDNDLQGTPLLTLDQAAEISKRKNIIVYGIGTIDMIEENKNEFKNAVLKTGGSFYLPNTQSVKKIVDNIESTSKSLIKVDSKKFNIDDPFVPFILLCTASICLIIINRRVIK